MGAKGLTARQLSAEFGVNVWVDTVAEVAEVTGAAFEVDCAIARIQSMMEQPTARRKRTALCRRVQLPPHTAPLVIGRQGSMVKKIFEVRTRSCVEARGCVAVTLAVCPLCPDNRGTCFS